jgi:hypothetical protein
MGGVASFSDVALLNSLRKTTDWPSRLPPKAAIAPTDGGPSIWRVHNALHASIGRFRPRAVFLYV